MYINIHISTFEIVSTDPDPDLNLAHFKNLNSKSKFAKVNAIKMRKQLAVKFINLFFKTVLFKLLSFEENVKENI